MPITNVRQGSGVRVAAKFQSAQGDPVEYFEWEDIDILRADEAPAPDPAVEIISQTGTTGSPYESAEGVSKVGIQAIVDTVIKPNPLTLQLFYESMLGVVPVSIGVGPTGGDLKEIEGFELGITKFLSYLWDTTFEAVRANDVYIHTIEWNSRASENLVMQVTGDGFSLDKIGPQLTTQKLARRDTYAHKTSIFEDLIGGTPIGIFATEQTFRVEHGRFLSRGNSVAPNFIAKDGRIIVSGTLRTRLSDETTIWFDRLLDCKESDFRLRYVQQDGKILEVDIRNATFEGTTLPRVTPEGTMDEFVVNWTARQRGDEFPFTIRVEE